MTNIRNEYAELTKENNQLKKDLLQFQEYYKQWNQKFVTRKQKRKRYDYYDYNDNSSENEDDENYFIPKRKPKNIRRKQILYDDVDEVEYEPSSPTED